VQITPKDAEQIRQSIIDPQVRLAIGKQLERARIRREEIIAARKAKKERCPKP
jgi:hypothetical protein